MGRRLRVTVITNMWPNDAQPWTGVFVKREVEALARVGDLDTQVIHVPTALGRHRYVTHARIVRRRLKQHRPDVVHFHYGLSQVLCPWWSGPSVVTLHGSDVRMAWQRAVSTWFLRANPRRAAILVASELQAYLRNDLPDARIIPCGVDASTFRPIDKSAARRELGIRTRGPVVLYPASPEREVKNYPLFRQALRHLSRRHGLEVTALHLSDVGPDQVPTWFGAADVVLLTSHHEGSPMVVKEALACHRPVVSTPVGDVRRYTGGALPCMVARAWDAEELALLVVEALAMQEWPGLAQEVPTVEEEASAVVDVYRSLLVAS